MRDAFILYILSAIEEPTNAKYDFILYIRSNGFSNKANTA